MSRSGLAELRHRSPEVSHQAVGKPVGPAVHGQRLAALPGIPDDRRLADVGDLFDHIELAQAIDALRQLSHRRHARFVLGKARQLGENLQVGPEQVLPVPSSAFPTPARRPHNSRLDTQRFGAGFGVALTPWEQGVARMLHEILERT